MGRELTATVEKNIKSSTKFNDELRKFSGGAAVATAEELLRVLSAIGGPLKVMPSQMEAMAKEFKAAADAARIMGDLKLAEEYEQLAKTLAPVVQFQQRYNVTIGEFVTLNPSFSGAIREQTSLFEQQRDVIHIGVLPNLMDLTDSWVGFTQKVFEDDPRPEVKKWSDGFDGLAQSLAQLAVVSGESFAGIVRDIAKIITAMDLATESAENLEKAYRNTSEEGERTSDAVSGAVGAFTAMAGATDSSSTAVNVLGGALAGAKIGAVFGPMGAAVGAVAGAMVGLVRSLSGVSKAVKEARKDLAEFEQQLWATLTPAQAIESQGVPWKATLIAVRDTYLALGRSVEDALLVVEAMWDTDNPQRSAQAIAEVSAAFAELEADNERLTAAMDRYGLSVEDMGHKFKQTQINTTAGEFIEDFRVLAGAVDDVNIVLERMAPEVNEFIRTTVQMGGQVPREMQPIIGKMIEMGLLTDESGNKFTELGQIPFAASLTDSLTLIADKLDELITRIGLDLPRVIRDIPDGRFTVRGDVDMPDLPDGALPEFQSGSRGIRDFGAEGTVAVLHGRERVQTEAQMLAEFQQGGRSGAEPSGVGTEVAAALDRVMDRLEHVLPIRLRDAVQGAV